MRDILLTTELLEDWRVIDRMYSRYREPIQRILYSADTMPEQERTAILSGCQTTIKKGDV
jgi:hypothetical protein